MKGRQPRWEYKGKPIFSTEDLTDMEKALWNEVVENRIFTKQGCIYYKKCKDIIYITRITNERKYRRNRKQKKE